MTAFNTFSNLPVIDISIVTYNSSKWVDIFFKSLLRQDYPKNLINILINDNKSTDNTLELLNLVISNYSHKFRTFHICRTENLGFGSGHNNNLRKGNADYFLVSNIDLEFDDDAIVTAVNTAVFDDNDVASWEFRQKPFEHHKYYNPVTLETYWSSHACNLFRRSALEYVKGYDEKIFLYGEDVELSYRLRDNGFRIKYCPSAICWHYTYEHENQVKRLQFLGSILANSYIRLRYGSLRQITAILFIYLKLFLSAPVIENQSFALLQNVYTIFKNGLYFLSSRKKSNKLFPINNWNRDYGFRRDGAFYRYHHHQSEITSLPLVSVITRTYKGRLPWLKEAIASVINQTYSNIELVIVEDGSNEAKNYAEQIGNNNKIKVVYKEEPKRGRCHAGNIGLSLASGKFIVFLDDDDLFFADHIEVLTTELLAHPEVSATYSLSWEVSTKLVSLDPLIYKEVSHQTRYRQRFSKFIMLHHNYIPIQSILFDRKLYEDYGGFDESLENLEDWNLWTRYCLNHNFLLIDKTTSMYRVTNDLEQRASRQQVLDSYYDIALEKHKQLMVTVTGQEILDFFFQKNKSTCKGKKHKVKSFVFKYKGLKKIWLLLSSYFQKFRF